MSRTSYIIDKEVYYFNNIKFIELVRKDYPCIVSKPKQTCFTISQDVKEKYDSISDVLDYAEEDVPGCEGIYGWYHIDKQTGMYTSPRNIKVVQALAAVLDIKDVKDLLTKSHNIELEELKSKPTKDSSDPLTIILGVILDYVKSVDYNYIPDSEEKAWVFYRDLINIARFYATENKCTEKQLKIIDSIYDFVNSCDGPDAINEYLISLNPRLAFFCSPFEIMEESTESTVELYKCGITMKFIPTMEQIYKRKEYFDTHVGDKSELFMMELAETVRMNYLSGK